MKRLIQGLGVGALLLALLGLEERSARRGCLNFRNMSLHRKGRV